MKEKIVDQQVLLATKQWTQALPVVSAFVGAIVRDFSARDDLLQEIAVAVIGSYDKYDAGKPFQPWALGIARNQIRTYLRQQRRDRLVFDEQVIANLLDSFDDSATSYSQHLNHLQKCLSKLDDKARQFLKLRYQDDLKPAAIARQLNQAANTVSKALQRIRDLLRDCVLREAAAEELR